MGPGSKLDVIIVYIVNLKGDKRSISTESSSVVSIMREYILFCEQEEQNFHHSPGFYVWSM